MKKKFLVTLAFAGLLSLVACDNNDESANRYNRYNRGLDNVTYNRDYDNNDNTNNRGYLNNNTANRDYDDNIANRRSDYNDNRDYSYDYDDTVNNRGYDYNDNIASNRGNNGNTTTDNRNNRTDRHYDFVASLGFKNVVNPNGDTYHERYRLNRESAANNDIFHGWRHTWVDPNEYVNKDIDVYRYTGDFNGETRTIHIMSYNGEVLGGYHFGSGETAENARIINYNGYSSRLSNDFRGTWDGLFDT